MLNTNVLKITGKQPTEMNFDAFKKAVQRHPTNFPLDSNRYPYFIKDRKKSEASIMAFANTARPIIHPHLLKLMHDFLSYKRAHGSAIEKRLYQDMTLDQFLTRLLTLRPMGFYGPSDKYMLRTRETGTGGFETIGTDKEQKPLILQDYISYDEMQISSMIGVATPTYFVNKGTKTNNGIPGDARTFEDNGVMIGIVGARCEVPERNEFAHMIITPKQNISEKGYGKASINKHPHAHFAEFYNQGDEKEHYFPSFEEASHDTSGKYFKLHNGNFLNVAVYKARMRAVIEPLLVEANARGEKSNQNVFMDVAGIGLGVWAVEREIQTSLQLEVYAQILSEIHLPRITDINFIRFPSVSATIWPKLLERFHFSDCKNSVQIHHIKRDPASRLQENHQGKLLINNYSWDGNAQPGNEYWFGGSCLSASGDPVAACYSQISELQNSLINRNICGENAHCALNGQMLAIQAFDGVHVGNNYQEFTANIDKLVDSSTNKLKM